MRRTLLSALTMIVAAAVLFGAAPARADTVGADAIPRTHGDSYSNFGLAFLSEQFTVSGLITAWETWIQSLDPNLPPEMAMLVLKQKLGGAATEFLVKYADSRKVSLDYNAFLTNYYVNAPAYLGVWIGGAKVSNSRVQPTGSENYTADGALGTVPTAGDTVNFSGGTVNRDYSLQVEFDTNAPPPPAHMPLPTAVWMGLGLLATLGVGRKLRRRAHMA